MKGCACPAMILLSLLLFYSIDIAGTKTALQMIWVPPDSAQLSTRAQAHNLLRQL